MVILRLKAKNKLFKLIRQHSEKFKNLDDLFEVLFPFFKTKNQLKRHTKFNSEINQNYDNRKFKQEYTYIWNGLDSFDNILKGWIPNRLINIFRKYMKRESKIFIKNLLIKWLGKIDKLFFERIWKARNEDMLQQEEKNNISKTLKRKSLSKSRAKSKRVTRDTNKILFSGKKKSSVRALDNNLEIKIRTLFGLNRKDFQ